MLYHLHRPFKMVTTLPTKSSTSTFPIKNNEPITIVAVDLFDRYTPEESPIGRCRFKLCLATTDTGIRFLLHDERDAKNLIHNARQEGSRQQDPKNWGMERDEWGKPSER
jgi:hypothetical protein